MSKNMASSMPEDTKESDTTSVDSQKSATKYTLESISSSSDSSSEVKFGILLGLIKVNEIKEKDVIETALNLVRMNINFKEKAIFLYFNFSIICN